MGSAAIGKEWLHQRKDTWRTTNGACGNRKGVGTSKEGYVEDNEWGVRQ